MFTSDEVSPGAEVTQPGISGRVPRFINHATFATTSDLRARVGMNLTKIGWAGLSAGIFEWSQQYCISLVYRLHCVNEKAIDTNIFFKI